MASNPTKETVAKLTQDRQRRTSELRSIGLRTAFAYHGNATFCFFYDEGNPEDVKAYAQTVRMETEVKDPKYARYVAFSRAVEALVHPEPKFYNLFMGDRNKVNVQHIMKQTGTPGPRSTFPAPILVKINELISRSQGTQQTLAG